MKMRLRLAAAIALLGTTAATGLANAEEAYATTDVNMRAGPSTRFPRVTTLPAGAVVRLYGCTRAWSWCDANWQGVRGWISGRYLEAAYHGHRTVIPEYAPSAGLPVIDFEFGTYWDRWYRERPWYRARDRWRRAWRSGWTVEVEPERSYRLMKPEPRRGHVPPGIRKKGLASVPPACKSRAGADPPRRSMSKRKPAASALHRMRSREENSMMRKWRRLDEPGLEVFRIMPDGDGFRAISTIVHAGVEAFGAAYVWRLDQDWRTRRLDLRLFGPTPREMKIQRASGGWLVDGREVPALASCDEIDLSATPFCNTLALRLLKGPGALTALYVSLPSLQVSPSRQRYDSLGETRWRYIDLGVAEGFEADIEVDQDGLVTGYEGLFETLE